MQLSKDALRWVVGGRLCRDILQWVSVCYVYIIQSHATSYGKKRLYVYIYIVFSFANLKRSNFYALREYSDSMDRIIIYILRQLYIINNVNVCDESWNNVVEFQLSQGEELFIYKVKHKEMLINGQIYSQ